MRINYKKYIFIFIFIILLFFLIKSRRIPYSISGFRNNNTIFLLWTGDNNLGSNRQKSIDNIKLVSECNTILITPANLSQYIHPDHPLHESYNYLSYVHRADFLRTYLMNFYGGGYSDIKKASGSWKNSFDALYNSDKWICGYAEIEGGVGHPPLNNKWKELIGNGAYICKANTPLTNLWYNEMIAFLDEKLELLKKHPAKHPDDCAEKGEGYPIRWTEMLGRIFHQVVYKYKDNIMNTLPPPVFVDFR